MIFYNRFVELAELKEFIGAADIYITPYFNEAQIASGTLAYCFGAGRRWCPLPIGTPRSCWPMTTGVLVPSTTPDAIAREVLGLLDDARRNACGRTPTKWGGKWCGQRGLFLHAGLREGPQ